LRELADRAAVRLERAVVVDRVLGVLGRCFPAARSRACARRAHARAGPCLRARRDAARLGDDEGVTITEAALQRRALKSAVAASARLLVRERWDSPFQGMATGFAIPLAAGGELYGVLDSATPGRRRARADEHGVHVDRPGLAFALRTIRLQEDAIGLRDYQARLLDSANALILGIDRTWRITVCNRALLELTGSRATRCSVATYATFISREQRQPDHGVLAALAGQHHAAFTVMLPTRTRPVRSVWSIAPVGPRGTAGGPIDAVVAIGQDQSKIDLLQQQIVRAERLATLGELAAGVVHELNNPLTSITVYAEYLVRKLESQGTDAADIEKLRRIGASAQRILRFSRDLVQYARPSGKETESVDLAAVVRQSVSICEHLVERGGITLGIEVDPQLPVVQAVAGQLEQVLINLITNAVHAVENGGRVIVRAQVENAAAIAIEVADSGRAFPSSIATDLRAVFHDQGRWQGHGLGLPIVRNYRRAAPRADLGGPIRSRLEQHFA
jgi:C4-dicarboxylate-specific signal transduction histidine kinase